MYVPSPVLSSLIHGSTGRSNLMTMLLGDEEVRKLTTVKDRVGRTFEVQRLYIVQYLHGQVYFRFDQIAGLNCVQHSVLNKHCSRPVKSTHIHGIDCYH